MASAFPSFALPLLQPEATAPPSGAAAALVLMQENGRNGAQQRSRRIFMPSRLHHFNIQTEGTLDRDLYDDI